MTIGTLILVIVAFIGITVVIPLAWLLIDNPDCAQADFEEYEDGE